MTTKRLIIVCEGKTESRFAQDVLAPHFGASGVHTSAQTVPTSPGHKGGGGPQKWLPYVQRTVRGANAAMAADKIVVVTTMFDYYPSHLWSDHADELAKTALDRVSSIEASMLHQIAPMCRPGTFIPYLQLHEFEALVLVDLAQLGAMGFTSIRSIELDHLSSEVSYRGPEAINDGVNTAPSMRLTSIANEYKKAIHGPVLTERIGLPRLRAACPHFNEWLNRLEAALGLK